MTAEPIDPGVIELAGRVFDLARGGYTDDLVAYVDAGVPVNLTNDKGDTLLVLAAYHGHPDTVAALLDRGADHSRANDRGQTALAAAVFRQSTESVARLLAAGADPDAGGPSARATATFFQLPAMGELLGSVAERGEPVGPRTWADRSGVRGASTMGEEATWRCNRTCRVPGSPAPVRWRRAPRPDDVAPPVDPAATPAPRCRLRLDRGIAPDLALQPTGSLPRWLLLLIGAATATIAVAGLREVAWLVAPVFLALVVVVALTPVERWLRRTARPGWLATTVLLLLVWSVLLGFVALLVVSVAQMAALLPDYAEPAEDLINSVVADLNDAGLVSGQLSDLVAAIDYGQVVGIATGLLASLTDAFSTLVLLLIALVFITIEASGFGRRMALVAAERPHLPVAMTLFAQGTRSYLLVSTVFGALVAFADWIALMIIGIPAAALWALLSFITNYVPNIGFVLGLLPPALLGLLAGGWPDFIAVVITYSVLNFVIQTLIQPRFVGDSVGLSVTVTFIALLFWGWVLGALGALLAIPLTLLIKALLVDVDPRGHWLDALLREEPRAPRTMRARRRMHARRAALASVRRLHHVRRPHGARGAHEDPAPPDGEPPSS